MLVRTRGAGKWAGDRKWLMIKHRDAAASSEDLTVSKPLSVVSRRTMAGIARAAGASARQVALAQAADPARAPAASTGEASPSTIENRTTHRAASTRAKKRSA